MVTWSPEDVDVGIQSLLVQIYTILLSTLLSLLSDSQKRLSVVDARFALWVSSSPLTVYTVVASISDLCGINTGLYKRIKSHRYIVRTLGASVLLLWTGLSMTAGLSSTAFKGSWCRVSTFPEWLLEVVMFHIFSLLYQGGSLGIPTITLLTPWVVFLVRRRSQLKMDIKLSSEGASKLHLPWTFLKCAWYVPVVGSQLAKSNTIKAHDRPQSQVVCLLPVHILRRFVGMAGHHLRHRCIWVGIRTLLWSGVAASLRHLPSNSQ